MKRRGDFRLSRSGVEHSCNDLLSARHAVILRVEDLLAIAVVS